MFIVVAIADSSGQYYTNQNKVWAFGSHAGLAFTSGSPVPFSTSMVTYEGCASVSNAAGSLLFYTNGRDVFNSSGAVMPHGLLIVLFNPDDATQGAAIVPVIGNPNQYYVFSKENDWFGTTGQLVYCIVDMSLNGGTGDVISSTLRTPLADGLTDKMTVVAGNNCDIWLLVHSREYTEVRAYDITSTGISSPVISTIGTFTGTSAYRGGVLKVSPNRTKIVCANEAPSSGIELYDFNPTTGVVSNCQVLNTGGHAYGAEFSPDNTKLYFTQWGSLYQYDISLSTTSAIIASLVFLSSGPPGFPQQADIKLGPDGKIYVLNNGTNFLDRIDNPNAPGTACGYTTHAITLLSGTNCYLGLPNIFISVAPHDTSYTHHDSAVCLPAGGSFTITAHDTGSGSGYLWDDGTTTTRTRSISAAGTYWVKIYNRCHLTIDTIHVSLLLPGLLPGTTTICAGTTVTLSPLVAGGTWNSSTTSVASVGSGSGSVTGVTTGTAIISYTTPAGCVATRTVAVVSSVTLSSMGVSNVCVGTTATCNAIPAGGVWHSVSPSVATIDSVTGVITGVSAGMATISYALLTSCGSAVGALTIFSYPPSVPITGAGTLCVGSTALLGETTTGGTWSSSNSAVATMTTTGTVTGVAAGTTIITYALLPGCRATAVETVSPLPAAIMGTATVCTGSTITLSDAVTGGTWSSSNTARATTGSTGVVTGVAAGTATITYTLPGGCTATATVTVSASPAAITGTASICIGGVTTLGNAITGGVWSSSNTLVATVDPFLGIVTADMTTGYTTISYTLGSGCAATIIVTVDLGPLPIVGTLNVCPGTITYLSDGIGGGTWSSSNTGVASVDGSDTVYGILAGTATISYLVGSCAAMAVVTVNPLPPPITGLSVICVGQPTTLHDAATGGTWSTTSSNITIDVVTGVVTGGFPGIGTIVYTLPTGCSVSSFVTVNTSPGAITGITHLCMGGTTTLSDVGGGTWTSSNTGVATIGTTEVVSGIATGTTNITYSLGASCSVTTTVTVNAPPPTISGITTLCAGGTTTLTDGSGTWSSGSTAVATIGSASGMVSGVASGTSAITFTSAVTGCSTRVTVTVNPLPAVITGGLSMCPGATTLLSDLTTGGTWSSGNTGIATVNLTGTVSGINPGTATITYTLPTGCSRSAIVTVNTLPATITGTMNVCAGAMTVLHDATTGGLWSSSPTSVATVTAGGIVSGVSSGTAVISYTAGCTRATVVTINPLPTITGPTAECVGATMTESTSPVGGTWVSVTTSVATISSTGVVTGVATGTTVIKYTTTAGCTALTTITISLSPTAIIGGATVCANDTMSLTDAVGGGVWSSSNTGVATMGSLNGVVSGMSPGTTTITYSLGSGCTVTKVISVNAAPAAITGSGSMCIGATITLADVTTGGIWSSSATAIATISGSGIVTGGAVGIDTITYTRAGCSARTTVTVNATPSAITGTLHVCAGSTTILSDVVSGGTWASSNTSIASVDAGGTVTGALTGTTTITYSLGAGCSVTKVITANPVSAITGSTGICAGATTALSNAITGGTWSSSATTIASVNSAGIVTGSAPGTVTITYTTAGGCTASAIVTVNLAPSAISGTLHVCAGAITPLGNSAGGGTWTSSNTGVATASGVGQVYGIIHGTTTITYSLGSGCIVTAIVTVNTSPAVIAGTLSICAGATTLLTNTTSGAWSIVPTSVATISSTGLVSGINPGTAIVSYTISGCAATTIVTVNTLPSIITGTLHACVGAVTTLTNATTGGTWSSSNTIVATANILIGDITGATAGTATITYSLAAGCSIAAIVTINAAPPPISGITGVCVGSVTSLSDAAGGGVWSSGNTAVATVSATGVVNGTSLGTATISYAVSGCVATTVVTINSLPPAITGNTRVCAGSTTTLSDVGGGTWSSTPVGIATINAAGMVNGVAAGTAVIAYSMGAGCTVTAVVTVDAVPLPITGTVEVCLGYTTLLSDASGGGMWSSSNTGIATITSGGVVSGLSGGPSTISYTNSAGCAATRLVTVVAVPPILGVGNMCAYSTTMPLYDSAAGGFWTSTLAGIASSGVVTPYAAGVATVTYTLPLGCYITTVLTVNPLPGPVVGLNHLCLGSTLHLSDTTSGGVWSSSNTAVAPVSGGGIVSGALAGTATISYTLPTGCASTEAMTVDVFPSAGSITGTAVLCVGSSTSLADAIPGGVWSASNTAATVSGGVILGVIAGTSTISYTVGNSCGSVSATRTVTINPLPVAGIISGASSVCTGDSIMLSDGVTSGVWSSTAATTVAGGVVHGVIAGVDTIRYTVSNSCGTATATKIITVNTLPEAGTISALDTICTGFTVTLLDTITGGVWSSSNEHISITGAGVISAVSPGVATISYSVTNTCGTSTASITVAVKSGPVVGVITGNASVCVGTKDTLTVTPSGGTWNVSNGNVTISATSSDVIITGVTAGVDTIVYTLANDCGSAVAVFPVTVCNSTEGVAQLGSTQAGEMLHVWPNPNDGVFSVLLISDVDAPVQLIVTNIIGEKVKEISTVTNRITPLKLKTAAGIYFINATTAGNSYAAKVVVEQ